MALGEGTACRWRVYTNALGKAAIARKTAEEAAPTEAPVVEDAEASPEVATAIAGLEAPPAQRTRRARVDAEPAAQVEAAVG